MQPTSLLLLLLAHGPDLPPLTVVGEDNHGEPVEADQHYLAAVPRGAAGVTDHQERPQGGEERGGEEWPASGGLAGVREEGGGGLAGGRRCAGSGWSCSGCGTGEEEALFLLFYETDKWDRGATSANNYLLNSR
jgi:hypothetical protein